MVALGNDAPVDAGSTQPANGGFVVVVGTAVLGGLVVGELLLVDFSFEPADVLGATVAVSVEELRPFGATIHQTTDITSAMATAATTLATPAPYRRALPETATPPTSCLDDASASHTRRARPTENRAQPGNGAQCDGATPA